ncbi:MAG TPA: phosphatidate cytidylyltransferase [Dehalococcoidales bacterium]|nr:phosphatidate cytidylyltransferase [Dehalococcoidales bacterium]
MLKKRIITSVIAIPLVIAILWFGYLGNSWFITAFVAAWGALAVLEFYRLLRPQKISPIYIIGVLWTIAFIVLQHPAITGHNVTVNGSNLPLVPLFVTTGFLLSLILVLARKEKYNAFPSLAWTWAGILYLGWLLGYAVSLYTAPDGRNWMFYALFCTFGSDTSAYFIGRSLGKHKATPAISPNKTWEGCLGGVLGSVVVSLLFLLPHPVSLSAHLNVWQAVVLGLLVSVFGQIGDLVESLFKRNVGAKDSGNVMPGHGGFLDRMDSILFAIVIVYFWMLFLG